MRFLLAAVAAVCGLAVLVGVDLDVAKVLAVAVIAAAAATVAP